jgi:hypothetical protein
MLAEGQMQVICPVTDRIASVYELSEPSIKVRFLKVKDSVSVPPEKMETILQKQGLDRVINQTKLCPALTHNVEHGHPHAEVRKRPDKPLAQLHLVGWRGTVALDLRSEVVSKTVCPDKISMQCVDV